MKILMIHPHDIFSPNEPWTTRIVSLAKEFKAKGHKVKLAYCPLDIPEAKIHVDLEGIETVVLSRKAGINTLLDNIGKVKEAAQWADMIHFQKCFHYAAIPALIAGWLLNKPLHYDWDDWEEKIWYHSNRLSIHTVLFGNFIRLIERSIPRLTDTVSVSSRKLEELCLRFGVKKENIAKAPVGADLKVFSPGISGEQLRKDYRFSGSSVVLYVGQLHGGQYVRILIEAANIVLHKCPDAVFLIVGQGYMLEELKKVTLNLGIEERVVFVGSVEPSLIPHYIAAADVCVASFEKNEVTICKSPLKVAEYLSSGKPIVASLVGEMRNMVGGVGLLVEPGNPQKLASGIVKLLKNEPLRREMGQRARRRAEERYNWERTAENLIKIYRAACTS